MDGGADQDNFDPTPTKLRNVQFMENVVDFMIGDERAMALRSHWPSRRTDIC